MAKFGLVHIGNCHRGNPDYGGKEPAGANSLDDIQQFAGPITLKGSEIFPIPFIRLLSISRNRSKKRVRNAFERFRTSGYRV
jgi:hypothetical protein